MLEIIMWLGNIIVELHKKFPKNWTSFDTLNNSKSVAKAKYRKRKRKTSLCTLAQSLQELTQLCAHHSCHQAPAVDAAALMRALASQVIDTCHTGGHRRGQGCLAHRRANPSSISPLTLAPSRSIH